MLPLRQRIPPAVSRRDCDGWQTVRACALLVGVVDMTESTDIFSDLSKLRLAQDFHQQVGVQKILVPVPVRKPHKQEFIRVNPAPEYRLA